METKVFNGKKITIRKLVKKDLGNVKKFQDFINSLIREDAQIMVNKRISLKEERKWIGSWLKEIKKQKAVYLIAENNDRIVGATSIRLQPWRMSHIGKLGITIRNGYRGMGLGTYLTKEILKLAKKELKPKPKIIRLSVYPNNKPAIGLYKKFGFKKVASIPKQIQHKGKLLDEIIMLLKL